MREEKRIYDTRREEKRRVRCERGRDKDIRDKKRRE